MLNFLTACILQCMGILVCHHLDSFLSIIDSQSTITYVYISYITVIISKISKLLVNHQPKLSRSLIWLVELQDQYIFLQFASYQPAPAPLEPPFWWSTRSHEQVFTSHRWSAISSRELTCRLVKLLEWYMCPSKALVSQFFKYQTLTNCGLKFTHKFYP